MIMLFPVSRFGIKIMPTKKCGKNAKLQAYDWVKSQLTYFRWPTKILKSGPRKNTVIELPEYLDMADAFVIARAGFVQLGID